MPQFLNTQSFYRELLNMINNCDHELVIIVPYIKMTDEIFLALEKANSRNVETTLVYREKKVNQRELDRLHQLDNINILHHPNIHCKCYYDGENVIIGSLNLYDFSIQNNREMGLLVSVRSMTRPKTEEELESSMMSLASDGINDTDSFLEEVQSIFNGSSIEKKSKDTIDEGFNIEIIHTSRQRSELLAQKMTVIFLNKRFESFRDGCTYKVRCRNFFDKVDVVFEGHRFYIDLPYSKKQIEEIFVRDETLYFQTEKGLKFKAYINSYSSSATIYFDRSNKRTQEVYERGDEIYLKAFKLGLKLFFNDYNQRLKKHKI